MNRYSNNPYTVEELEEMIDYIDRRINAKMEVKFLEYNDLKKGLKDIHFQHDSLNDIFRRQRISRGELFKLAGFRFYNMYKPFDIAKSAMNMVFIDYEGNILLDEQKYLLECDAELKNYLKYNRRRTMVVRETDMCDYLIVPVKDINNVCEITGLINQIVEQDEDFFLDDKTNAKRYITIPAVSLVIREVAVPILKKAKVNSVFFFGEEKE